MVTRDHVLAAVDAIVARRGSQHFSAELVAAELSLTSGRKVTEHEARSALRDLPGEVGKRRAGRHTWYERYPQAMRNAWREADELASLLGGEANHYTIDDHPATVTLTLERARQLAERTKS